MRILSGNIIMDTALLTVVKGRIEPPKTVRGRVTLYTAKCKK